MSFHESVDEYVDLLEYGPVARNRSFKNYKKNPIESQNTNVEDRSKFHYQPIAPVTQVTGLQFGLLDPQYLRKVSAVKVTNYTLNCKGYQAKNSPNDAIFGPIDRDTICLYCRLNPCKCNGQIGHIDLAYPCYNTIFLDRIMKIIKCVCFYCYELLLHKNNPKFINIMSRNLNSEQRLNLFEKACKTETRCPHCNFFQFRYSWNDLQMIRKYKKPKKKEKLLAEQQQKLINDNDNDEKNNTNDHTNNAVNTDEFLPMTALMVRQIFEQISDENIRLLGADPEKARAEWMIWTALPVPTMSSRPTSKYGNNSKNRGDDTLTKILQYIAKVNNDLIKHGKRILMERRVEKHALAKDNDIDDDDNDVAELEEEKNIEHQQQQQQEEETNDMVTEHVDKKRKKTASTYTAVFREKLNRRKTALSKKQNRVNLQFNDQGHVSVVRFNNVDEMLDKKQQTTLDDGSDNKKRKQPEEHFITDAELSEMYEGTDLFYDIDFALNEKTMDLVEDLQNLVGMYLKDDIKLKSTKINRLRSIFKLKSSHRTKWKGKRGRFRNTLNAKRCDFSARGVIDPNPRNEVDEIGVPVYILKTLTYPDIVTPWNYRQLQRAILNGPHIYPGANRVVDVNGEEYDLRFVDRYSFKLETNMIVHRHILEGEYIIANRQPSLHKMNVMAHRVRPIYRWSIEISLCTTTPYNADFDGDAIVLHAPQTIGARIEMMQLLAVTKQLLNPQSSKPIIALVQDSLLSCYYMTRDDTLIEVEDFAQYCSQDPSRSANMTLPLPCIWYREKTNNEWKRVYTGKQLFSEMLPKDYHKVGNHVTGYFNKNSCSSTTTTTTCMGGNDIIMTPNDQNSYYYYTKIQEALNKHYTDLKNTEPGPFYWYFQPKCVETTNSVIVSFSIPRSSPIFDKYNTENKSKEQLLFDSLTIESSIIPPWLTCDYMNEVFKRENVSVLVKEYKITVNDEYLCKNYAMFGFQIWTSEAYETHTQLQLCVEYALDLINNDKNVTVINHQLLTGTLTSSMLGKSSHGICHDIIHQYQLPGVGKWMSTLTKISDAFELDTGFSIGISDFVYKHENVLAKKLESILNTIDQFPLLQSSLVHQQPYENELTEAEKKLVNEFQEDTICKLLQQTSDHMGKLMETCLHPNNRMDDLRLCGAKGDTFNRTQIMMTVGQQSVNNKRLQMNNARLTAHFPNDISHFKNPELLDDTTKRKYTDLLTQKGYVKNSFAKGLNPHEYLSHAFGGRQGVLETHFVTRKKGYDYRKLEKAMDCNMIEFDFTVRSGMKNIIEFVFAHDGFDATYLVHVKMDDMLRMSNKSFYDTFGVAITSPEFARMWECEQKIPSQHQKFKAENPKCLHDLMDGETQHLILLRDTILTTALQNNAMFTYQTIETTFTLPFNLTEMFYRHAFRQHKRESILGYQFAETMMTPSLLIRLNHSLIEHLYSHYPAVVYRNYPLEFHILSTLCIKNVIIKERLSVDTYADLMVDIITTFKRCVASPGEMCGALSSQMLGQGATQDSLNSFRKAGLGKYSGKQTDTITLEQVISMSEKSSNARMYLFLKPTEDIVWMLSNKKKEEIKIYVQNETNKFLHEHQSRFEKLNPHEQHQFRLMYEKRAYTHELYKYVSNVIENRTLKYVVDDCKVELENDMLNTNIESDREWLLPIYNSMNSEERYAICQSSPFVIRLNISEARCAELDMDIEQVVARIEAFLNDDLINMDDNDIEEEYNTNNFENNMFYQMVESSCIALHSPLLIVKKEKNNTTNEFSNKRYWIVRIYMHTESKYYKQFYAKRNTQSQAQTQYQSRSYMDLLSHFLIKNVNIHGIEKVKNAYVEEIDVETINPTSTQAISLTREYVIVTNGSNMLEALAHPFIDTKRSFTNQPREAGSLWGMMASTAVLSRNLFKGLRDTGNNVNYRYAHHLIRTMCHRGRIMALKRQEMNSVRTNSVLQLASFEKAIETIANASIVAEKDPLKCVISNSLVGNVPPIGAANADIQISDSQEVKNELVEAHAEFVERNVIKTLNQVDINVLLYNSGEEKIFDNNSNNNNTNSSSSATTTTTIQYLGYQNFMIDTNNSDDSNNQFAQSNQQIESKLQRVQEIINKKTQHKELQKQFFEKIQHQLKNNSKNQQIQRKTKQNVDTLNKLTRNKKDKHKMKSFFSDIPAWDPFSQPTITKTNRSVYFDFDPKTLDNMFF